MIRSILAALLLCCALSIAAQQPQTPRPHPGGAPAKVVAAPIIPEALKTELFKAQTLELQMEKALMQAQQRVNKAKSALAEVCGPKYSVAIVDDANPICAASPDVSK